MSKCRTLTEDIQNITIRDFFTDIYTTYRTLTADSEGAIRIAVSRMDAWHGHPVRLSELTDNLVASWIKHAEDANRYAPKTIKHTRDEVCRVWKFAFELGYCAAGPKEVRPVHVPRKNPTAWTADELARLFNAVESLQGFLPNGLPRSLYFRILLRVAYETGLRRADLLAVDIRTIRDDGLFIVTMRKTGLPHLTRVRPETLEALREAAAVLAAQDDPAPFKPLRWPYVLRQLYFYLEKITTSAGVPHAALQQLRRSGATHMEASLPGSAAVFLGHTTPVVADVHYIDRTIANRCLQPPRPSETHDAVRSQLARVLADPSESVSQAGKQPRPGKRAPDVKHAARSRPATTRKTYPEANATETNLEDHAS